jgi:hypothetical protein
VGPLVAESGLIQRPQEWSNRRPLQEH